MNRVLFAVGLMFIMIGVVSMVRSAYPLYQANYATQYDSMAERCNGTDPYLHPQLADANWMLLLSGFFTFIGFNLAMLGYKNVFQRGTME